MNVLICWVGTCLLVVFKGEPKGTPKVLRSPLKKDTAMLNRSQNYVGVFWGVNMSLEQRVVFRMSLS